MLLQIIIFGWEKQLSFVHTKKRGILHSMRNFKNQSVLLPRIGEASNRIQGKILMKFKPLKYGCVSN